MNILFVCAGNTCRSPMAETIARDIFNKKNIAGCVSSAGLMASGAGAASVNAVRAMEKMGLRLEEHVSRQVNSEMLRDADLVLTMTGGLERSVRNMAPEYAHKVFTLGSCAGEECDVSDPYGGDLEVYAACAEELKRLIEAFIKERGLE